MNLRLVLGDQLNQKVSSLSDINKNTDVVLMCEVWEEATYVKHHKKKIAFIFSAMRHFAQELKEKGYKVHYTKLDDPDNAGSFSAELERTISIYKPEKVIITEPSEYRVLQDIKSLDLDVPIEVRPDNRFLSTHSEFSSWAEGRKQLRMEYFYRQMRKKYNILMSGDKPEGGEWNYDNENRKAPKEGLSIPQSFMSEPDEITQEVIDLVSERFSKHFGDLYPFHFAVTRNQALQALEQFIKERLINFGDYQDAMIQGEPWMYHSHLSFYINCGLLLPLECVEAAELAYREQQAPLNAVEGFIRQIIGWREYVRGIYWLKMPKYEDENFLQAKRKLPWLYWGGDTQMNCLSQCVKETKENAYAHHIQRLMVLGNFALIAGLDPDEVNEWYMIVYADAYQWVELPNVTGMILFADGGVLGSKPYAASGAYINKMSDYCKRCRYKVSKKNGPDACPFNYLYWDFLIRNEDKLRSNHRLTMIYRTLERMSEEKVEAIKNDSKRFFKTLDGGEIV
ncbi:MAG: cryptochrome/photolyase family protein [Alphaproteobacteria bacterium]|nr:cryptochrome/photolyase family protein [Alphaproteobacteria bacterium]